MIWTMVQMEYVTGTEAIFDIGTIFPRTVMTKTTAFETSASVCIVAIEDLKRDRVVQEGRLR